jgi:glycosyltransferase involved in cell wall biosynthesis
LLKSDITTSRRFLKSKIIHFGSVGTLIGNDGIKLSRPKGPKIVLTWFHVARDDPRNKFAKELNEKVDLVHTSCEQTKRDLAGLGGEADKIVVIPLGVDLENFKLLNDKKEIRAQVGIPQGKFLVGSFQKDGNGWGQGNEPKLVKGPDVFCDAIEKVAKQVDVHVLLTGPARGYVKNRLEKAGISYTHKFLENYLEIVRYYNALDLYLVASRAEGGPKAILESMACGVPVVSTKVGMAPDCIVEGENGMLCEVEDAGCLAEKILRLAGDPGLRAKLAGGGLESAKEFDIKEIAKKYYKQIYQKLI